jgi:hypothetical protein
MGTIYLAEYVGPTHVSSRATDTFTTRQDVSPVYVPVIPSSKLVPGTQISILAAGRYNTTGTPTLTMGFWFGTRTAITGDIAVSSGIVTATATMWPWKMKWDGICSAAGAAGTLIGEGELQLGASLSTFNSEVPIPITDALTTVTIDTTIERAIGVSAAWSASSASNQIKVIYHRVLLLN